MFAIARIFPPSATCSDRHHLANAAVSACAALSSTLDSVRARHGSTKKGGAVHPFLASCLQDPRGAVIQKLDPISGAIVGRRCLGLGEKDRCAMLSCVGFDMKEPMDTYLTSPPPEDLGRRQLAIDLAEDAFVQAEFVLADAVRSGLPIDVDAASTARDAARRALADAELPLKFVTNFGLVGEGGRQRRR